MSFSTVTIPANIAVIPVDTRLIPKVLYLPTVSTNSGRYLLFKDYYGTSSNSTITFSTTGFDLLDDYNWSYTFSNAWGSMSFVSDGVRSWRTLGLYNGGLTPASPSFLPNQIAGLSVWLDASVSSYITLTGANVTLWSDRSGNGRNGTGTGTIGYTTNAINGLSALSFTAIDNSYVRGNFPNTSTTVTCFAVAMMTASAEANTRILSLGQSGAVDYNSASYAAAICRTGGTNTFYSYRNNSGTTSLTMTYGTPFLIECLYDGTNKYLYINGTGTSNASTGNFNTVSYQIGASFAEETTTNFYGYIGEEVMYSNALATLQRQQVEGYLAWKWGLQGSLPAGHPYKNAPP